MDSVHVPSCYRLGHHIGIRVYHGYSILHEVLTENGFYNPNPIESNERQFGRPVAGKMNYVPKIS